MAARKSIFIHSSRLDKFAYPEDCPFNTSRAGKTRNILKSMHFLTGSGISELTPFPAERVALKKFHSAKYLHALVAAGKGDFNAEAFRMGIGTPDCPIFKGMCEYSILACGATLAGANMILSNSAEVAFNPSGGYHHAGPERAAGFCYINDVALACLVLAEAGKRVLYLDVDVHHGDGVQDAFYDQANVMTISMHESGKTLFPGTGFEDEIGIGKGKGYCVNMPLPAGTYDEIYMKSFNEVVIPLIGSYNPDVIVFELGADALAGDPLAHLQLTNNTYADIINVLLVYNKPILMTGGGGYHIGNTVRAWALAWSVLAGIDDSCDANIGMGGVMLENTEWRGGLRDRELAVTAQQREMVSPQVEAMIEKIKKNIFKLHNL